MKPRLIEVETLYRGYITLKRATFEVDGGQSFTREVIVHGEAVAVLPYDPARRVVMLIRVPRGPVALAGDGRPQLEAPAGMLEGEPPEACARREALEETGVQLSGLEKVAFAWCTPGVSTERTHLFLAPYAEADRVAAGGGLESENELIEVVETPIDELARLLDAGEIADMKTLALAQALRLGHPGLFQPTPASA